MAKIIFRLVLVMLALLVAASVLLQRNLFASPAAVVANELREAGHYTTADYVYDFALWKATIAVNRAELLAAKGHIRLGMGKWKEAFDFATRAIALDGECRAARMVRLRAAMRLLAGDQPVAEYVEKDSNVLRRIAPQEHWGYFFPAKLRVMRGRAASAIGYLDEAVERNRRFAESRFLRGIINVAAGNSTQAAEDLEVCIRLAPRFKPAFRALAELYVRINVDVAAIRVYEALMALGGPRAMDCNNLAWLYATSEVSRLRDGSKAVDYARQALELEPGPEHKDTLAAALARDGQFARAESVQAEALEELRTVSPDSSHIRDFAFRLQLYAQNTPYVDR